MNKLKNTGEVKLLLIVESQLINIEEMRGLENSHWIQTTLINGS